MSKSIGVDEDTHAALAALKRENETFDDLLSRLAARRAEAVRAGAGLREETDAADGARAARETMNRDVGSDA